MARFPDKPTKDESTALQSYIHLFARLYPWYVWHRTCCDDAADMHDRASGECAGHFRHILSRFPPQVSSRSSAAAWACHVHNEVNKSLKKEIFDCSKIGDFYDCGCADDEAGTGDGKSSVSADGSTTVMDEDQTSKLVQNGRDFDADALEPLKLEKEGSVPSPSGKRYQRD